MSTKFPRVLLRESVSIRKLISFHYFEYAKGYVFEGEQHDFWEFLYVDKGEVEIRANDAVFELKQGQIVFHKPEEFHSVCVRQHQKPPNLIVISFECKSPAMNYFENKIIALNDAERNRLSNILQEGFHSFQPPFDNPALHALARNNDAPFASEQLMKSFLEILLVSLIRRQDRPTLRKSRNLPPLSTVWKEKCEAQQIRQITEYMKQHISQPLTMDLICKQFHLGKSRLKNLFRSQTGTGVLEYFKTLKIEQAKSIIRENQYNFSEIAEILGYGSIHYFSRAFKKSTGMSPTEYAKSVKARI